MLHLNLNVKIMQYYKWNCQKILIFKNIFFLMMSFSFITFLVVIMLLEM